MIAEFEAKYPNGADWTIKDILFYSDGNKIYQEEVADNEAEPTITVSAATPE